MPPVLRPCTPPTIGRALELHRLEALLDSGSRAITIWGPGGSGKTHLARLLLDRVATPTARCELHETHEVGDVVRGLAAAAGTGLEQRERRRADVERLLEELALARPTLLLLDGVERVVRPAHALLRACLARTPHRFLFTSREPLELPGEALVELGPLSEAEAVELLRARAAALACPPPESELALRIVNRLDRLPLALELAAAKLLVLSPELLLERLDRQLSVLRDAGSRRTLEAVVRGSWELLAADEQRALALCALFRGGFRAEAAESLLERAGLDDPLARIEALRRRSLLRADAAAGRPRFHLYAAVRELALGELGALGLGELGPRRHAEATLALTERLARAPGSQDALACESENLLAVHERCLGVDDELAARAALSLHPLLLRSGPTAAHRSLLDATLARPGLDGALATRLLIARGELLRQRGRLADAERDLVRAQRLARRRGDGPSETHALILLGAVERTRGRAQAALRRLRTALGSARAAGDDALTASCLGELGAALAGLGRLREACVQHRMALDLHRSLGDRLHESIQLSHLGVATHRLGGTEEALPLHQAALALHRELGNRRFEAAELSHLAYVHHQLGQLAAARSLYGEALQIGEGAGDHRLQAIVRCYLGDLETEAGEPLRARQLLREALGHHERLEDRPQQAVTWLHLGYSHERSAEPAEAVQALRCAIALASKEQVWVQAAARAHLAVLHRRAGEDARAAAAARGARRWLARIESRELRLTLRLLCSERPSPAELAAARAAARGSSELRRACRWLEGGDARELRVSEDGTRFRLGACEVDLARRGPVRRLLAHLVSVRLAHPGVGVPWHALFAAGWPGQTALPEAMLQRVYTAVWTLRKLGLESALLSRDDGYLLDPALSVRSA
jgi:tetratricopeptide (TPR) repeat protein